jgi:hypothetical protein
MKRLLSSLAILFAAISLEAQIAHDLTVYSEDGEAFTLYINGQKVNEAPAASVTASNINFDYAKVKVEFQKDGLPAIERKNLQIATPGTGAKGPVAAVYAIKEKKVNR